MCVMRNLTPLGILLLYCFLVPPTGLPVGQQGPPPPGGYNPNYPSGGNTSRGYNQGPPRTANGAHPTQSPTTGYGQALPVDYRTPAGGCNSTGGDNTGPQSHPVGGGYPSRPPGPTAMVNSNQVGPDQALSRGAPPSGFPMQPGMNSPYAKPGGNPPSSQSMLNQYSGPQQVNSSPGPLQSGPPSSTVTGPPSRVTGPAVQFPLPGSLPGGPGPYGHGGAGIPPVSRNSPSTPDGPVFEKSFNASG